MWWLLVEEVLLPCLWVVVCVVDFEFVPVCVPCDLVVLPLPCEGVIVNLVSVRVP